MGFMDRLRNSERRRRGVGSYIHCPDHVKRAHFQIARIVVKRLLKKKGFPNVTGQQSNRIYDSQISSRAARILKLPIRQNNIVRISVSIEITN